MDPKHSIIKELQCIWIFFLLFLDGSDTTSHTNTIELYGPNKETALYPMTPSDGDRSYGTYDKNEDDFSDDYKSYEVSMVACVFHKDKRFLVFYFLDVFVEFFINRTKWLNLF